MPTSTAQPATSHPGPPWLAPLWSRTEIDLQWLAVGFVMLGSALVFFGWRAMLSVTVTAVVCVIVFVLWRKALQLIRPNGPQDSSLHALVLGVLGGLSMPAVTQPSMPVLAGILLGILAGVIGRTHRLRIHPVAAVVVILWLLPVVLIPWDTTFLDRRGFDVVPAVLKPRFAVRGDLHDYAPRSDRAWWDHHSDPFPALRRSETHAMFLRNQQAMALSRPLLVEALSTGKLPRMGELILGAVPGPMGATSPMLVIALGLMMLYRRQGWWAMPVLALLAALVTMLLLPIRAGTGWTILAAPLIHLGPAAATTYLAYAILSSPLALIVMILAPMTAPMSKVGKAVYGLILGSTTMALLWFASAPPIAFASLVLAGAVSRPLDALQRSRFVK